MIRDPVITLGVFWTIMCTPRFDSRQAYKSDPQGLNAQSERLHRRPFVVFLYSMLLLWSALLGRACLAAAAFSSLQAEDASTKLETYHNPIISGFAPDPSCIRVDEQYFCVTSSFSAFPGLPVYTSRDLVQWQQIGKDSCIE